MPTIMQTWIEWSVPVAQFALNWLLQSLVLTAIGLAVAAGARRFGSATQSAIYRTTLAAVLVAPLATLVLGRLGVSGWSIALPAATVAAAPAAEAPPALVAIEPELPPSVPAVVNHPEPIAYDIPVASRSFRPSVETVDAPLYAPPSPPQVMEPVIEPVIETPSVAEAVPVAAVPSEPAGSLYGTILGAVTALWLAVVVGSLLGLARSCLLLRRLCRTAVPVDGATLALCRELCRTYAVPVPAIRRSPFVTSPCVIGLMRPTILLNEDAALASPPLSSTTTPPLSKGGPGGSGAMQDTLSPLHDSPTHPSPLHPSLPSILAHELAHIARHDAFWNLLRYVSSAFLFMQPLMWWLARRLEATAEEICDDCVVRLGADRVRYAEQLYNLAVLSLPAPAATAVGMKTRRTALAERIRRILDTSRQLSTSVSFRRWAAIAVAGVFLTALAGLLGTAGDRPSARDIDVAAADATPPLDPPANGGTNEPPPKAATESAPFSFAERTGVEASRSLAEAAEPKNAAAARSTEPATSEPSPIQNPKSKIENPPAAVPPEGGTTSGADANPTVTFTGTVVDPAGKPVAGATVSIVRTATGERSIVTDDVVVVGRAASAADGSFAVSVPRLQQRALGATDFVRFSYVAIATADNFGLAWEDMNAAEADRALSLQLVADATPLEGRIIDLEGRPVVGARVHVRGITTAKSNLDAWLAYLRENPPPKLSVDQLYSMADPWTGDHERASFPAGPSLNVDPMPGVAQVVTGADGRFRIRGVGGDRLVTLVLEGDTIAKTWLTAVTHKMEPVPAHPYFGDPRTRVGMHFGTTFDYSADPMQVISGTVRDTDSGAPLADAVVEATRIGGSTWSIESFLRTRTDANGRYRLVGVPKAPRDARHELRVVPDRTQPYFRTNVPVPRADNLAPVTCDITLKRAAWVTGRVTDKQTGEPLPSLVSYFPYLDNPEAPRFPNFRTGVPSMGYDAQYATDADGVYRIPAIPGRGVVTALALNSAAYPAGGGARELDWTTPERLDGTERRLVYELVGPTVVNFVRAVEIAELAEESLADVQLTPHDRQSIQIEDDAGRPLAGVEVAGTHPVSPVLPVYQFNNVLGRGPREADAAAVVVGLAAGPRRMLFLHAERRLGSAIVLDGSSARVRLQPCAMISGRVVDAAGKPVAGLSVSAQIPETEFPVTPGVSAGWGRHPQPVQRIDTDAEGRFRLDQILPGARYRLYYGRQSPPVEIDEVKPAATIDLGDLVGKEPEKPIPSLGTFQSFGTAEKPAAPPTPAGGAAKPAAGMPAGAPAKPAPAAADNAAASTGPAAISGDTIVVRGIVVDPDGKPVMGARVVIARASNNWSMRKLASHVMAQSTSRRDGTFELTALIPDAAEEERRGPARWQKPKLFAVAGKFGPAWADLRALADREQVVLRLAPDDLPLAGRVVGLEGQPMAGVTVTVRSVDIPRDSASAADQVTKEFQEAARSITRGSTLGVTKDLMQLAERSAIQSAGAVCDEDSVLPAPVVTDRDGRFRIAGIGRDRGASLIFTGPTTTYHAAHMQTRRVDAPPEAQASRAGGTSFRTTATLGFDGTIAVGPSAPIQGRIFDAESKQPLPGVTVTTRSWAGSDSLIEGMITTVTDAEGRYRLEGLPQGKGNSLSVMPADDQAYFIVEQEVSEGTGLRPVALDVPLKRGLWIEGRVTDKATGEPVAATIHFYPFLSNMHANGHPNFNMSLTANWTGDRYRTNADGSYRVVGIPGRGMITARTGDNRYRMGVGAERIAGMDERGRFQTFNRVSANYFQALGEVDIATGAPSGRCDLQLDKGQSLKIVLVDRSGTSATGVLVAGRTPRDDDYDARSFNSSQVEIFGLDADSSRPVVFYQPENKLGQVLSGQTLAGRPAAGTRNRDAAHPIVQASEDGGLVVRLDPCCTVVGRLLGADDQPLADAQIVFAILPPEGSRLKPATLDSVKTDQAGRFSFDGLPPGGNYAIAGAAAGGRSSLIVPTLRSEPGKRIDLGDVRLQPRPAGGASQQSAADKAAPKAPATPPLNPPANWGKQESAPAAAVPPGRTVSDSTTTTAQATPGERRPAGERPAAPPEGGTTSGTGPAQPATSGTSSSATRDDARSSIENPKSKIETPLVISGRVLGPDGKPAVGAHVAAIGLKTAAMHGGVFSARDEVLAETTTAADGRYELRLVGVSAKTYSYANVIARAEATGLAWRRFDPGATEVEASFELAPEQVIRGRLIGIEGQPGAKLELSVASVLLVARSFEQQSQQQGVGYREFAAAPKAWPPAIVADAEGRFVVRGVPAGHGVSLNVKGTDLFARQDILLNSGMPEQRGERDATYRPLVRNFKPGEEGVLPLSPAQIFEGVVRYEDTGAPAPNARLAIWASQEGSGSRISVQGQADANGRYRINPQPGSQFGVTAYPPDGVPYLAREAGSIRWDQGATVKEVNVSLPRGVLVRGGITESVSRAPVTGAGVQYIPQSGTARGMNVVTGWQNTCISNDEGTFEIAVPAGPGALVANVPQGNFVLREFGSDELRTGRPGGTRNYAHAAQHIHPEPGAEPVSVKIALERGTSVSGKLVNAAGQSIEQALVISRLKIHGGTLFWRGFPEEVLSSRFEISGLADGREYPVHILDPKNRLGATVLVKASEPNPTVVLQPCGQARARFVGAQGEPLADFRPTFSMVVTPGASQYDLAAMQRGELAADADFVGNIDRTNYGNGPRTDADGRIVLPVLIPGARYQLVGVRNKTPYVKEFVAESGTTEELGEIIFERVQ